MNNEEQASKEHSKESHPTAVVVTYYNSATVFELFCKQCNNLVLIRKLSFRNST